MILNNNIVNSIEDIKPYANSTIQKYQTSVIPAMYDMTLERRYSFDIHGVYHSSYRSDCLLYVSNDIPFTSNQKRHVYAGTLDKLVASGEVSPLLVFVNGKFIKWTDVIIIKDCKYAYIMICNVLVEKANIKFVLIPRYMRYVEGDAEKTEDTIFIFDENGLCVDEMEFGKTYTTISKVNSEDFYYEEKILVPNKIQDCNLPNKYRLNRSNLLIFKDGLLDTSSKVEIHGLNTFSVGYNKFFDNKMLCKIFYDTNSDLLSKDNLLNVRHDVVIKDYIERNNKIPQYVADLNKEFDFNYDRFTSYEENVYNSLKYIMDYNSGLLNQVYKNKSNILSRRYSGKSVKERLDDKNIFRFSKKIDDSFNNSAIVFINGELSPYYCMMKDKHTLYEIPMHGLKDDDVIEILYFKKTENHIVPIIFDSRGDDTYYIAPYVNMENMKLFAMHIYDKEFMIESKHDVQFELDFVWEKIKDTKYKIYPEDPYYYNKRLNLVSKRQFLYSYIKINQDEIYDVELPDTFRFCNNKHQYLVFINGRRIDTDHFKLTITKKTRPFDDLAVYLNITLNKGDRLEVFYIPEEIEEVVINTNIDVKGKLVIDRTKLAYNFSKDLYLVFANGKKITPDELYDIDSNKIMITKDIKTLKNLSILKYIKDEDYLSELFNQDRDKITKIFDSLDESELNSLYQNVEITDKEKDIEFNTVPMEAVMNKLIRDYWIRPYINNGDSFLYDFDDEFTERDEDGNIIIRSLDATKGFQIK